MFVQNKIVDFLLRSAAGIAVGMVFGWALSQVSYHLTPDKESVQRAPQQVSIVIPYGTAAQVAQGAYNPRLPENLSLIQGDVLLVKNEDTVAHQLGPLFIPPNASSALSLDDAVDNNFTCSFTPTKIMGLNVLPRVTPGLQLEAVLAIGLPSGMMLAIYSYLYTPRKRQPDPIA